MTIWDVHSRRQVSGLVCMIVSIAGVSVGMGYAEEVGCDLRLQADFASYLDLLGDRDRSIARNALEASMTYWKVDPAYDEVRQDVLNLPEGATLLRIEFGAEPDRRYGSLWFVESQDDVIEFATGYGIDGVARRRVPRPKWVSFERSISRIIESGTKNKIDSQGVDLPVYFVCGQLIDRDFFFILMEYPDQSPEYELVKRTLDLSSFRKIPVELRGSK
jgi:hypothetical protein